MRRILVAEDESLIALQLEELVLDLGWQPVGPITRVGEVLNFVARTDPHGAFIDINLRGESVLPILPQLKALKIPFIITSGYDPALLPQEFRNIPRIPKPFDEEELRRLCVAMFSAS